MPERDTDTRPRAQAEVERDQLRAALEQKEHLAAALRESEERLRQTLDAAEVGTWEWDIRANRVAWSPNIERIFGLPPGTFAGTYEAWLELVHPDDRELVTARVREALRTRRSYLSEFRFIRPDGSTGWQSTRGHVVADENGAPRVMRGVVIDVTARRIAEDAARMQAQLLETMTEGVSVTDGGGIIVYTNPAEDRMFGYARGELIGQHVTVQNAYPPEENARIVAGVIAELNAKGSWTGTWQNRRKDGTTFETRSRITRLLRDGRPHFVCVQEDVTQEQEAKRRAERLAEELRASERQLRASEARYRAFVSQSTEGIWRIEVDEPIDVALPPDAQIEDFYRHAFLAECNDAMARMYGYESADAILGKRLGDLLVREDERNTAYLHAFIASGYRLENAESHEIDRDGRKHVFDNSLVGFVEAGKLVRAWGTQRDVTPQVEAREQIEAASRAKDEFLAMLGHELRNPLSPILTALELMRLRGPHVFERERAIVERQVKHLVRLVDDLLDVSRMTRGKISLERQPIELADCVATAVELASPLLEQRAHRLSVQVPRGLTVSADPTRLAQVFANLLTNAAKYTPTGGLVTVIAAREGERARVCVRDTGMGIRPEILPRIFDLFVQEPQTLDRSEGGLGLGLAIVRTLVNMHGGSVSARSDGPGTGSEFTVELPLAQEGADGPHPRLERLPSRSADGRTVLVVDDNEDAAHMLGEALAELGFEVRVAHDGPAALNELSRVTPAIALLDIGLPVMDGYELARRVRGEPRLRSVRLVAVTGYGQASDRAAALDAGFDEHLVKPIDLAALERVLERFVSEETRS